MTEEELIREFRDNGWYQLKDEIYNRYRFTPAKIEMEEHHVGVYRSKKDNHSRRNFDEALKALSKARRNDSLAYLALKQIQAIYREEKKLAEESAAKRLKYRQVIIKPMVDAYFEWVKENLSKVSAKGKTHKGLSYCINQEKYLRIFLEDGEVPIDNNAAEQSIRGVCIGKKNWVMIDTIAGAESSAIIYSIAETAKANNLKPYDYFEYLLSEIPNHMDDKDLSFLEVLLPWSEKLPDHCRKPKPASKR